MEPELYKVDASQRASIELMVISLLLDSIFYGKKRKARKVEQKNAPTKLHLQRLQKFLQRILKNRREMLKRKACNSSILVF